MIASTARKQYVGKKGQQGASLLLVLVLLTALLFGVVSLARMSEANTLIAGNIASKDTALQASEVGVSEAYAAIQALTTPDVSDASWYFATYDRANDSPNSGLPKNVNWNSAVLKTKDVGGYTVRYVVERFCTVAPVTDRANQCAVKKAYSESSGKAGTEILEATPGTQYRVTVNVTGPKESSTFVQALIVN